jgi:hypothetical protein
MTSRFWEYWSEYFVILSDLYKLEEKDTQNYNLACNSLTNQTNQPTNQTHGAG